MAYQKRILSTLSLTSLALALAVSTAPGAQAATTHRPSSETSLSTDSTESAYGASRYGADHAVDWFQRRIGNTQYEGLCELAVERAAGSRWYRSAISHWRHSQKHRNYHAPRGAFVFWNTGRWGHVGIADGEGGFYSNWIHHRIGHRDDLDYFANYLGWSWT